MTKIGIDKVTIIGGGILGSQIGLMCAYYNKDVVFTSRSEESTKKTKAKIEQYSTIMINELEKLKTSLPNIEGPCPRGLIPKNCELTKEKIDELISNFKVNITEKINIETDMAKAVGDADIIIEAILENPKAKINLFESIKDLIPENTIICTNTSNFVPSTFAEHTGRPEKFLALHFANFIWINNIAEVMSHPGTDEDVYNKVVQFSEEIGMNPLKLQKEQPRYVLNSLLIPFLQNARELWAKGVADPETIDKSWELGTGAPIGPFKIMDTIGIKTIYNINQMYPGANEEGSVTNKIGKLLKEMIDKGEIGVNAGKGFYKY
ncbi:3-hydroxybutyryl-CoA dehydrogenase [Neocallimastix lanati (nom. inval.)]|jgi:3-hydroxybutyryl-CoA dehydrogenase|nr:3-hydroxybutyryl-CoA dehydrogenase [Neocallimastix sp. JGI-2020a]